MIGDPSLWGSCLRQDPRSSRLASPISHRAESVLKRTKLKHTKLTCHFEENNIGRQGTNSMSRILPLITLLVGQTISLAQEGSGVLVGTVTDRSNAVVPGATVTITHTGTGLTRTTTTDSSGDYELRSLPIGRYDVVVTGSGFATLKSTGAEIAVGTKTRLDVQMQLATVTQDITVTAHSAVIDTESGSGGALLSSSQVTNLPLNGRNFLQLVPLEPGVRQNFTSGRQSFTFNGAPPGQGVNLLVDGTDATGIETAEIGGIFTAPNQSTFTLGLDSISEFVVHANNYSTQYGKSLGGVIEVVTKSGTNDLHGNAFYFFRNDVLDANTIQGNAAGLPRPPLRFNQFGANSGAPIRRNKMFFWAGYEGARRRTGLTNTFTVLSDLGRSRIVDPAVAQAVTRWLPRANQPSTSNPDLALLVRNDVQPVQEDIGTVRYDYHISDKASFFVRYNIHNASGVNPLLGVNSAQTVTERQQLGTISWTRIFGPTTTLNLRVGANRIASGQNSAVPDPGFVVSGIFSVSGSFLYNYANAYTYAGDYTHIRGRNTLLAGFEYHTTRVNRNQEGYGNYTFLPGANQLTNFYNNVPDQYSSPSVIGGNSGSGGSMSEYVEDSIKVSRQLTITAGSRYDYFFRISEKYGRIIGIDGSAFPIANIKFRKPGEDVFPANVNGFGPRFGFAYTPKNKLVVRGGYGLFIGLNFPAVATGSAFSFVPPLIPTSLYDPYYAQSSIVFTKLQRPTLLFPDQSFVTPAALLANAPPPSPYLNDPTDWKNTYTHQWSLRIEEEIASETKLSVGYVGTRTLHILGNDYFNLIRPLQGNTRENPAFSNILLKSMNQSSFYSAMQVGLNRRLSRGFQLNANYTWSHSTDDILGFSGTNDPGGGYQTNIRRQNRGNSSFDVRHLVTIDYHYDMLPLAGFTAMPRVLREGWTLGGITTLRTGIPFDVVTGSNVGDGVHIQRPDILCKNPSTGKSAGLFAQMVNPSCFTRPAMDSSSGFFIGNLARNAYYSPAIVNFDFNLTKSTKLNERVTHQLRAEFFNILNNKSFFSPVNSLNNPNFGRILGAAAGRQIQFAAKLIF